MDTAHGFYSIAHTLLGKILSILPIISELLLSITLHKYRSELNSQMHEVNNITNYWCWEIPHLQTIISPFAGGGTDQIIHCIDY